MVCFTCVCVLKCSQNSSVRGVNIKYFYWTNEFQLKLYALFETFLRNSISHITDQFIGYRVTGAARSLQSCPILRDPIDSSRPGSPAPGILQARTLEWVAISFSNAWKWKVKVKSLSRVWLLGTPWTAAYQAPPSMGFSRQEYWSGVPLPSPVTESRPN